MLNRTDKFVVYLDIDTLEYMYLDYTNERSYPVMKKLYALLHEGFVNNWLLVPLSMDFILAFIKDNRIDQQFLNMMGGIGQIQFHQRFTLKTLQLIRIINSFFENTYTKPMWRDAFVRNPDERYTPGFNKYGSISAQNALTALEREKKTSQIYQFIESYKVGKQVDSLAGLHFRSLWEEFPDLIIPYLPAVGTPQVHMNKFLEYEYIKDIPEFHILSNVLYPLLDAYGIEEVEAGKRDSELLAAETIASYMPYCHFYVTNVDIAELINMNGINDIYNVRVYDHNESSLYKLIHDITERFKAQSKFVEGDAKSQTIFRKGLSKL
ncbi:hypothetical protein LLG96_12435 [bacterium]|nr:hypothetical protein [bacterium]